MHVALDSINVEQGQHWSRTCQPLPCNCSPLVQPPKQCIITGLWPRAISKSVQNQGQERAAHHVFIPLFFLCARAELEEVLHRDMWQQVHHHQQQQPCVRRTGAHWAWRADSWASDAAKCPSLAEAASRGAHNFATAAVAGAIRAHHVPMCAEGWGVNVAVLPRALFGILASEACQWVCRGTLFRALACEEGAASSSSGWPRHGVGPVGLGSSAPPAD